MSIFALILNGAVVQIDVATFPVAPSLVWTSDISGVTPSPQPGWTANEAAGTWTFTAPPLPPPPVLTIAQQASAALSAGLAITSTSAPTLNGTYPCDTATQAKLNSMYSLIQRAGGNSFPGGLTALPWPTMTGVVTFSSVTEFLAMETAVGDYVLALDLIITTGTGTMPANSVAIA